MTRKRILIVEDDPAVRQAVHTMLSAHCDTVVAADAMAATAEARKSKPDLIILDLGVPAGGGLTVLQRLKSNPALSLVPVLILSGLDRVTNEQKALSAGATAYLEKPVRQAELLSKIWELLGQPQEPV